MFKIRAQMMWFIAALYYGYEFLHRVAPSVLTNTLRQNLMVNEAQLGMIGAMYFYAYAALQIPAGILIDRYGAKRPLLIASGVLTLGSFLFATSTSIHAAYLSRFLIGAGSAFAFIACLKIAAQSFKLTSMPLIVGVTNLFGTLGALLGSAPLVFLVNSQGWYVAMMVLSFIGLFITALIGLFVKDGPDNINPGSPLPTQGRLKALLKDGHIWLLGLYSALLVAPIAALPEMWGVEYVKIAFHLPDAHAASIIHTIFIGTAIGGPLLGWLATQVYNKFNFMAFATLNAFLLLVCFIYWTTLPVLSLYAILFLYGFLTTNMLICFTLAVQLRPAMQGITIGFINTLIMAGGGLAQYMVGFMLDKLSTAHEGLYRVEDYQLALSILPLCLLVAIFLVMRLQFKQVRA